MTDIQFNKKILSQKNVLIASNIKLYQRSRLFHLPQIQIYSLGFLYLCICPEYKYLFQCGENSGGMAAMPRGKLSESEESYRICTHSFLISTHNLPHFSSKSPFFICSSIFSFYFPHFS